MAAADDAEVARALREAVERVHLLPKCKESRTFVAAAEKLATALRAPRPCALLDAGARADVTHAVRDVKDVAAKAAAPQPRAALLDEARRRSRFRRHRVGGNSVANANTLRAVDRRAIDGAAKRIEATAQVALYKARLADPGRLMDVELADDAPARREWEFSLVKSPITPLSARDMDREPHGAIVPALWRGVRVSVRVLRRDRDRFYTEGDYLFRLGDSPSVPKLLGGHWQSSSAKASDADVGYLVLEIVQGASLDKLVRQQRLAATLNQLRVLDRIVTALIHAQTVVPALSHQDLHPGNIFLVPTSASSPLSCTLTPPPADAATSSAPQSCAQSPTVTPKSSPPPPPPPAVSLVDEQGDMGADVASATDSNSIDVDDAPVLDESTAALDGASEEDDMGVNGEPGSPVRSDTTLDARVRRAASTAAARGDVALARGMLSMHSMQCRMRAASNISNLPSASTLSQRAAAALLGATTSTKQPPRGAARSQPAYLVKVLDFPPSTEAQARRQRTSWANSQIAGYCAPELATPRMWRRAGEHRQRSQISALRSASVDGTAAADRRRSSSSSNTTSSAIVNTPTVPRTALATVARPASPRILPRSYSYPRKRIAPIDSADGVMFADEDAFNRPPSNVDPLAATQHPFGRVQSLDSAHITPVSNDRHAAVPRKMQTVHAGGGERASSATRVQAAAPGGAAASGDRARVAIYGSGSHGDDDDVAKIGKRERRGHDEAKLRRIGREEAKGIGNIYRRISAHHDRLAAVAEKAQPQQHNDVNKTQLTGNILGTVLGRPNRSFDSTNGALAIAQEASAEMRMGVIGKVDVWSLGWLLYYMATGEHPPSDCWSRMHPLDGIEMSALAPQIADIVRVCVVHDANKRTTLPDLKRRLEGHMRQSLFMKGLALLDASPRHAFHLLDKVVGIKVSRSSGDSSLGSNTALINDSAIGADFGDGTDDAVEVDAALQRRANVQQQRTERGGAAREKRPRSALPFGRIASSFSESRDVRASSQQQQRPCARHGGGTDERAGAVGLNNRTKVALSTLPLVIVRRVEWEFAARKYECTSSDLLKLRRALICGRWTKSEVYDGELAIAYLRRRCAQGVSSAQSALGWVYRWGAGGATKEVSRAMRLWEAAMESNDPEAANGLGLIYHHGRRDVGVDGRRAQRFYEIAVEQGYPAAAVNLGVMLHDGAAGLQMDGLSAKALYELACENGDAIAANNLGLLLQHGAPGVMKDEAAAVRAYELAVVRGERNHARRNLGELLWDGASTVERNIAQAIEQLALAIDEGDTPSRAAAQNKLRALISRDRDAVRHCLTRSLRKKYGDILLS